MHPLISGLAEGFAVIAPGATRLQKGLSGVARMLSGFPRLYFVLYGRLCGVCRWRWGVGLRVIRGV